MILGVIQLGNRNKSMWHVSSQNQHTGKLEGWGGGRWSLYRKAKLHLNHDGTHRKWTVFGEWSYTSCWGELIGAEEHSGWRKTPASDVSNTEISFYSANRAEQRKEQGETAKANSRQVTGQQTKKLTKNRHSAKSKSHSTPCTNVRILKAKTAKLKCLAMEEDRDGHFWSWNHDGMTSQWGIILLGYKQIYGQGRLGPNFLLA